jgi:DNA modification methylase
VDNLLLRGDCLDLMKTLPAGSVDCILTELPYGTTDNKWDSVIPMDRLWAAWRRVMRPGAPVILFTQQPFTTTVAASNLRELKTEWIWEKAVATGFLNAKKYPMKCHENILVFCDRLPPYFPQKTQGGLPYRTSKGANTSTNYSDAAASVSLNTDGSRYPRTVQRMCRRPLTDRGSHPTQKPLELLEYLIRTYTRPGELVLDCCAGSGSTLVAAIKTGRRFAGIELSPEYHRVAMERVFAATSSVRSAPQDALAAVGAAA